VDKRHAHELIDRLEASQLVTAVRFLEFMMLDPVARSLATAPIDDQPLSEEGERALNASKEWFERNQGVPHGEILAEFGMEPEDFLSQFDKPSPVRE
jgi:hypothetical protein